MNLTESINRIENERDRVIELVRGKFDEVLAALRQLDGPSPVVDTVKSAKPKAKNGRRKKARQEPQRHHRHIRTKHKPLATKVTGKSLEGATSPAAVRDAIMACLDHVATSFVEGRPEGLKGMDGSSLRAAVAKRLGIGLKWAAKEEFIRSVSNAQQRLKADGLLKRETGGWWVRAKEGP